MEIDGQVLVALRPMIIGQHRYGAGSLLPPNQIPERTLRAMVDGRPAGARWQVKDPTRFYPSPVALPKAAPPPPRPAAIEIVDDGDVVVSWRKTLALTAERCGGDVAVARDLLAADRAGTELFLRASRVHQHRERQRLRTFSLPSESLMP